MIEAARKATLKVGAAVVSHEMVKSANTILRCWIRSEYITEEDAVEIFNEALEEVRKANIAALEEFKREHETREAVWIDKIIRKYR